MSEFARSQWAKAARAVASAAAILDMDPDSAASRAYYAAFHGVTAVLAYRGLSFTKHTAVRAALHRDLIQAGLLAVDFGRDYDYLLDLRETADYGGVAEASRASAAKAAKYCFQGRSMRDPTRVCVVPPWHCSPTHSIETLRGRRFCHLLPLTATQDMSGVAPRVGFVITAVFFGKQWVSARRRLKKRLTWPVVEARRESHEAPERCSAKGRGRRTCLPGSR